MMTPIMAFPKIPEMTGSELLASRRNARFKQSPTCLAVGIAYGDFSALDHRQPNGWIGEVQGVTEGFLTLRTSLEDDF